MQYQSEWFDLYRRAVLENNLIRVNERVDAASQCIERRLVDGAIDPGERSEMQRCLRYLSLIRRVEYKLAS